METEQGIAPEWESVEVEVGTGERSEQTGGGVGVREGELVLSDQQGEDRREVGVLKVVMRHQRLRAGSTVAQI
jgi:hypothetical protein